MDLKDARHAFITGGASGIGLGVADALAARGLAVTIADVNEEALAAVLATRGNSLRGVVLDVRDREAWQRAKLAAEAAFGPVDVLVANAGIAPNGQPFGTMEPDSFDRIIAINLVGVFNAVHAFAAEMAARSRGHIVLTASQAGLVTTIPGVGAYSAAKFGVTAIGEALRTELAPQGVGVTVLVPGYVQTNLAANTRHVGGEVRDYSGVSMTSDVTSADVGAMVADGIARNAAYVITHKDVWPGVEARAQAIKAECDYRRGQP